MVKNRHLSNNTLFRESSKGFYMNPNNLHIEQSLVPYSAIQPRSLTPLLLHWSNLYFATHEFVEKGQSSRWCDGLRMTTTQSSSLSASHSSASTPGLKIGLQLYFCSVWCNTVHTTTNTWLHCSRSLRFTFRLWVSLKKPMPPSQQWNMHQQSDILISPCCVSEAFNLDFLQALLVDLDTWLNPRDP